MEDNRISIFGRNVDSSTTKTDPLLVVSNLSGVAFKIDSERNIHLTKNIYKNGQLYVQSSSASSSSSSSRQADNFSTSTRPNAVHLNAVNGGVLVDSNKNTTLRSQSDKERAIELTAKRGGISMDCQKDAILKAKQNITMEANKCSIDADLIVRDVNILEEIEKLREKIAKLEERQNLGTNTGSL